MLQGSNDHYSATLDEAELKEFCDSIGAGLQPSSVAGVDVDAATVFGDADAFGYDPVREEPEFSASGADGSGYNEISVPESPQVDPQASLDEQVAQAAAAVAQYDSLNPSAQSVAFDPIAMLDALIAKCELVDEMLGGKQELAAELMGEIQSVGGAEAFIAEQATLLEGFKEGLQRERATTFFSQSASDATNNNAVSDVPSLG